MIPGRLDLRDGSFGETMSTSSILAIAGIALASFAGASVDAATLNIVTTYTPGGQTVRTIDGASKRSEAFTDRQKELFGLAGIFWETVLTGFTGKGALSFPMTATMAAFDGAYNVAAYAGQTGLESVKGVNPTTGADKRFWRTTGGYMLFDADDFGAGKKTLSEDTFVAIAVHEMGHALGFGLLFGANGLMNDRSDTYLGGEAVAAFQRTYGTALAGIPLEQGGGHWAECWNAAARGVACNEDRTNDPEIMTPILANGKSTISPVTIAAFRDMGYFTIDPFSGISIPTARIAASVPTVPLPAAGVLLLAGLGGFTTLRRQRPA